MGLLLPPLLYLGSSGQFPEWLTFYVNDLKVLMKDLFMIRSRSRTPCKTKAPCVTSEEVLCCRALHLALSIDIPVDQVLQDITHLGSQVVDLNGSKPFKIFYGLGYPRRDFEYSAPWLSPSGLFSTCSC